MEQQEIDYIDKGWRESSTFFGTNEKVLESNRVDKILLEDRQVGSDTIISVYRGYKNDKVVFEIGASIDVTVVYK